MTTPLSSRDADEPHLGSYKLSRSLGLAWLLYGLLTVAAALALLGSTRPDLIPRAVVAVAPFSFGGFLVLFAIYRFALVRAGRYPPFRAFFQVGAGLLFILLLLPGAASRFGGRPRAFTDLIADGDPQIRALACEAARNRPLGRALALALAARLDDSVPTVREEAARSLVVLAGKDLGSGADAAQAQRRWQSWARSLPAP